MYVVAKCLLTSRKFAKFTVVYKPLHKDIIDGTHVVIFMTDIPDDLDYCSFEKTPYRVAVKSSYRAQISGVSLHMLFFATLRLIKHP